MNLQNEIDKINDMDSDLRRRINEALDIKQNPDITILNDSPRCFTISVNKLSSTKILTPEYYDFELQGKLINAMIKNSTRTQILPKLHKIIKTGFLPNINIESDGKILKSWEERIKINPTVIDCIKRVIEA